MHDAPDPFSPTYAQARARFLHAADGLALESHVEPRPGVEGETLAMDVARLGADDAAALLIVSSGCHGIEGYCGSGLQAALLRDGALRAQAAAAGVALLFVHAMNPWGFSHDRRVTFENVDLNRNFVDFARPLPRNAGYDELAQALLPPQWPPTAATEATIARYAAAHGPAALQAAVSAGQHDHPDGLFYGGRAPTWANTTLRAVLRRHAGRCARLAWIDVHTGLGESGVGERILASRADDTAALARAKSWWGDVTSMYDGSSTSANLSGNAFEAVYDECPQAEYTGIGLEYGTHPIEAVIGALRADHWLARAGAAAPPGMRAGVRQAMRAAFFTDTPEWKAAILAQGREAVAQAIAGLASRKGLGLQT
jgi:hypothetical protein